MTDAGHIRPTACASSTFMEIKMRIATLLIAFAASLAPSALLAQPLEPVFRAALVATAPGRAAAERVAQITAAVEAVDPAARTVTLKLPDGASVTLPVASGVQNLGQIHAGERV